MFNIGEGCSIQLIYCLEIPYLRDYVAFHSIVCCLPVSSLFVCLNMYIYISFEMLEQKALEDLSDM